MWEGSVTNAARVFGTKRFGNEVKMKILLTGGSGFVGRNLREYLVCRGYDVYAPSSKELDCMDEDKVRQCLQKGQYDQILHFAVYSDNSGQTKDSKKVLEANLRIFQNFSRHADLFGRMIYTGSGAEYDKRTPIMSVTEEDLGRHMLPSDQYGLAKYTATQMIEHSDNIYNLRLFGIFGKYEYWKTKYISNLCCKSLKGLPLSLRQNCYFDYLWIDDFCRLVERFMHLESPAYHVYNAVSGIRVSLYDLAKIVNDVAGVNREIIVCKEGLANEYTANNDRIRRELPEWTLTDMRDAVQELYEWYKAHIDEIDMYSLIYS